MVRTINKYLSVNLDVKNKKAKDITIKNEDLLHVTSIKNDPQWYKNEIETYNAELNNGFAKEANYQKEIEYQIWRDEELLKYIEQEKNNKL